MFAEYFPEACRARCNGPGDFQKPLPIMPDTTEGTRPQQVWAAPWHLLLVMHCQCNPFYHWIRKAGQVSLSDACGSGQHKP
jgi:hypothetical protein